MFTEYRPTQFEAKSFEKKTTEDGEIGTFEGYASTFGNVDLDGDVILPGAFTGLNDRNAVGTLRTKMLWQHDSREPTGFFEQITQDDKGLFVKGAIPLDNELGNRAYNALKRGIIDSMSVGFRIPKGGARWIEEEGKDAVREITKAILMEISLVTFPANQLATVTSVKAVDADTITERDVERLLKSAGFSRRDSQAFMQGGFTALKLRNSDARDAEGVDSNTAVNVRDAEDAAKELLISLRTMRAQMNSDLETLFVEKGITAP